MQNFVSRFRTIGEAQLAPVDGIPNQGVQPPRVFTLTGGVDIVFDSRPVNDPDRVADNSQLYDSQAPNLVDIMNVDAAKVYITLNGVPTAASYHYLLNACTVDGAGDGGYVSWNMGFKTIKVLGTAGKKIAVTIFANR